MALEDYGRKKFTAEEIAQIRHWFLSCEKYYKPPTPREMIEKRMDEFRESMEKKMYNDIPSLFDHEPEDTTYTTAKSKRDIWSTKYDWAEDRLQEERDDKKDADRFGWNTGNFWGIGNFEFKSAFPDGYVPFSRRQQNERDEGFEKWLNSLPSEGG